MTEKKLLSVIVPAYKQARTIYQDIRQIKKTLDQIRCDYELIVVVDGKVDKTFNEAKRCRSPKVKVLAYEQNHGKGYAIRYGMARAKGDPIAFIDAGMEIDPNGIRMILEHMEWYQADVMVGSKRHPVSQVEYPWERKVVSACYQFFVRFFTGLNIGDTQAGLKIYRRAVLEKVLPRLLVKRYAFDLEMLTVAHRLGFKKIYEAPVKLTYNFGDLTHAATFKDMQRALIDTLAIIYRLKFLRYYDDRNQRQWRYDPDLDFRVNLG